MSAGQPATTGKRRTLNAEIGHLAIPAFAALVAEPLFVLADTAIIGHLGTDALAALAACGVVLTTIIGTCVFLAYGTTTSVARHLGAGQPTAGYTAGVAGCWLAIGLGSLIAIIVYATAEPLTSQLTQTPTTTAQATSYLSISALGLPAMLTVLAATGVLRGGHNTVTPVVVATTGALSNVGFNYMLVYPAGLGIAGAAWGTVIAQYGMAIALAWCVIGKARAAGAPLTPHAGHIRSIAIAGVGLLTRTVALRSALVATTWVTATTGETNLATHQIAAALWTFISFAMDALAIAAQTMIATRLGAGNQRACRQVTRRLLLWGAVLGGGLAIIGVLGRGILPTVFTTDPAVTATLTTVIGIMAITMPVAAFVFVMDGVLIGAHAGRYLAWSSIIVAIGYLGILLATWALAPSTAYVPAIWWAFTLGFMGLRAITLAWGARDYLSHPRQAEVG